VLIVKKDIFYRLTVINEKIRSLWAINN